MVAPPGAGSPRADEHAGVTGEDEHDRRVGWLGLGFAVLCFLCGVLTAGILGATYAGLRGLDLDEAERDFGAFVVGTVGLWMGFLVLPVLWARRTGGPGRSLGLSARWTDLPLGVVVGLGSSVVTALVSANVLNKREQDALEVVAEKVIDRASGPVAVTLLVLVLCFGTPVAEEVFFRGLLFRSLQRVAPLLIALPVAAVVFGLVHYSGEVDSVKVVLVQLGLLSLFGAALCAVAHRTGRLAASIVAHATFNAVTVVSLLAAR
jgi:membrane protease YdiL (CAAX protease family)